MRLNKRTLAYRISTPVTSYKLEATTWCDKRKGNKDLLPENEMD